MNRAVRRLSVACLLLFVALLANVNFLQVLEAKSLRNNPHNSRVLLRTYSRPRGQIVVGGAAIANSVQTQDRLKYQRVYVQGPSTRRHRLLLADLGRRPASSGPRTASCPARTTGCSSGGCRTCSPGARPGGSVVLTIDPAARRPPTTGSRDRPARSWRSTRDRHDPRAGHRPSYDPNQLTSHDTAKVAAGLEGAERPAGAPAPRPGAVRDLPARLDVQGGHLGRRAEHRRSRRTR